MPITVKPVAPAELAPAFAWIETNPLFARYGMSRDSLAANLGKAATDPGAVVLGAFRGGERLVGFAWFVKRGAFDRSGYLRLIVVDPADRAGGVGRALMNALEREFLAPNGIFLLTTDVNREAQSFYAKLGYRKVGEIPDYVAPGLAEWIFHKPPPRD